MQSVPVSTTDQRYSSSVLASQGSTMKKTHHCLAVLLSLCLCVTGRPGPGAEPITCETSGIVLEGATAEITCDFHNGLNKTDDSFYVYRQNSGETVIIAICKWMDGNPDCRFVDNCELKEANPDGKVTFNIPSVEDRHSGEYVCKTLPAHEAYASTCTLTVEKNEIMRDHPVSCLASSPAKLGDDASVFCMFPTTIGMTGVTLERYYPGHKTNEEVVRCEKGKDCSVVKDGYWVDDRTDTYMWVRIPDVTMDKAGRYVCRSTYIQQESANCTLDVQNQGEEAAKASVLKQIEIPLYAILGCFVLLIIVGIAALIQSRFRSRHSMAQTKGDSQVC